MPQQRARGIGAPSQDGPRHQPVKVSEIQFFEDLIQIVANTLRSFDAFAAADLAYQI